MLKLMKNVKGAALVEYGILVGLIAILAIAAVLAMGEEVRTTFETVASSLESNLNGSL